MIYFKHDVFKSFENPLGTIMLQSYEGCLLVDFYWARQILISFFSDEGSTIDIYNTPTNRSFSSRNTVVSPVKLELTHPLREGDWISIEKHNNF